EVVRSIESIHYVGDLDHAGLDIAWKVRKRARALGLPAIFPASELHRQMLETARAFGHADGWPAQERVSEEERQMLLSFLSPSLRIPGEAVLRVGQTAMSLSSWKKTIIKSFPGQIVFCPAAVRRENQI